MKPSQSSERPCGRRCPNRAWAAALLMALLWCVFPANADNYYYQTRKGPEVTYLGNGEIQVNYLTYDYDGYDDYIDYMKAYVTLNGTSYSLFQHEGAHEDSGRDDYNSGYGQVMLTSNTGAEWVSSYNYASGSCRYRTLRFRLPECYWGRATLSVVGKFCYEQDDPNPLQFN